MSKSMSEEAEIVRPRPVMPDQWQLRTYAQLLANVEDGQLHDDITRELVEICSLLNEAVQNNDKASAGITVTVNFKVDRGVVEVLGEYKVKLPKPVRRRSVMHVSGTYFSTRDPRQNELPLRGLPSEAQQVRSL